MTSFVPDLKQFDGAGHGVQAIWVGMLTTEDWVFLIIDAKKLFKNINRIETMWKVHHLLPSGYRFFFNSYHHWSSLVLQKGNGTASFIHSREGVAQGYNLAMIAYGHPPAYQTP